MQQNKSNTKIERQWFAPFQATGFFKLAERVLQSNWFSVFVALIALLSNILGLDIFAFGVITALMVFINLFLRDARPAIPIVLLTVFCVSCKYAPGYGDGSDFYTTVPVLTVLGTFASLILITALFHLYYYGQFRGMLRKRALLGGLVAVCVACFLGGIFSSRYDAQNILIALLQLFSLLLIYLYFGATYTWRKKDTVYLARICVLAGVTVALQILHLYLRLYTVGTPLDGEWKGQIIVGWGVSNVAGTVMLIMLPMFFYLMQVDKRLGWLYYAAAIGVAVAIYFTLCRSAMLIGIPLLILGMAVSCILKGNRPVYIAMTAVIVVVSIGIVIFLFQSEPGADIIAFFREAKIDDRGRFELWTKDIDYFLTSPLFGEGFAAYYVDRGGDRPLMQLFSHNTLLCMLGKCGLFGLLAYGFHRWQTVKLFIKKPDMTRLFLCASVVCYIASGLLDNIFFFVYTTFYYMFFLMFAENLLNDKLAQQAETAAAEPENDQTGETKL